MYPSRFMKKVNLFNNWATCAAAESFNAEGGIL